MISGWLPSSCHLALKPGIQNHSLNHTKARIRSASRKPQALQKPLGCGLQNSLDSSTRARNSQSPLILIAHSFRGLQGLTLHKVRPSIWKKIGGDDGACIARARAGAEGNTKPLR